MCIKGFNILAYCLVLIGAINWGLVGIFNWNLVAFICGAGQTVCSVIVYCLILASAIWLIIATLLGRGNIELFRCETTNRKESK